MLSPSSIFLISPYDDYLRNVSMRSRIYLYMYAEWARNSCSREFQYGTLVRLNYLHI